MTIKAQSLSTGRTEVQGWSARVTGAVCQSDLDVWSYGGVNIRGGCCQGKLNCKKLMVQFVAKLLLPANMINDHLRLQVGAC